MREWDPSVTDSLGTDIVLGKKETRIFVNRVLLHLFLKRRNRKETHAFFAGKHRYSISVFAFSFCFICFALFRFVLFRFKTKNYGFKAEHNARKFGLYLTFYIKRCDTASDNKYRLSLFGNLNIVKLLFFYFLSVFVDAQ